MLLLSMAPLTACSGNDSYARPQVEAGKIGTVISANTPEVPKEARLQAFEVAPDSSMFLALAHRSLNGSNRIVVVPADGPPRVLADEDGMAFPDGPDMNPRGLAFDPRAQVLYVLDSHDDRIRMIDREGNRRTLVAYGGGRAKGPGSPNNFNEAMYLAVDPRSGTLFLADRCQVARVKGESVVVVAGARPTPCWDSAVDPEKLFGAGPRATAGETHGDIGGIAVDPATGDLLMAVNGDGVFRVKDDGSVSLVSLARTSEAPGSGKALDHLQGQLAGGDIAVDGTVDRLYVIETRSDLILRLAGDGSIEVIAGSGEGRSASDQDGMIATEVRLDNPERLAVDEQGCLYFAELNDPPLVRVIGF